MLGPFSATAVLIEKPSPEALSISPLEAVEEILEEVEDRRTGFWDFHDSVSIETPSPEAWSIISSKLKLKS